MNILVVGLGALGTVFSCLLKKQGHQVAALDVPSLASDLSDRKVAIRGIWGEHEAVLDVIAGQSDRLTGPFDLVILTVKSYDTSRAVASIKDLVSPGGYVILAQNGFGNYEAARELIPPERLVQARVIFGAETMGPGRSLVTVIADDVILGSPEGLIPEEDLERLADELNRAGIPTRVSPEVMKYMWGKILYNSALNSLGAILEVNYGVLADLPETRMVMDSVIREAFAVLSAMQEPVFWPDASAYLADFYERLVPPTAGHHPSMLQDIQRGRRTEIDALNGAICRLGQEYGVPTPVNQAITCLVKAKEQLVRHSKAGGEG